ncbi:MAG: heme utilization cystosolic carrier protein HutX, partial [Bacteroidales bacterium]|nr:heme utilization cystosolic carrier protein HutX [Bacteroidales bacterium]
MTVPAELAQRIAANPGLVIEQAAAQFEVSARDVVAALPASMRRFAPASAFEEVMADIAGWGEVTVIVHTEDGIFEMTTNVPRGEIGHGYFNLMSSSGLHGHLRHDRCGGLGFLERPFMGKPSAAILFFNIDGGIMFKVFVGRDETRALRVDQLEAFRALADRLAGPVEVGGVNPHP